MAKRPYFCACKDSHFIFSESRAEFQYHPGFAKIQKQKNIEALHQSILNANPRAKILEVSTKSSLRIGQRLSAFNLQWHINQKSYPVECIFQGCKTFVKGGPYKDIILKTPLEAKHDERLKNSGDLVSFSFRNRTWPLIPVSCFYDFVYLNALSSNRDLIEELIQFDTFTDIEFNPNKSFNCQARSVAIFVSLYWRNRLDYYLSSQENFITLYGRKQSDSLF